MADEPVMVEIRGGVIDGVVYFSASDICQSLRRTAEDYIAQADEEDDEEVTDVLLEFARGFQCEADEYDLIAMEMLTEAVEEAEREE